MDVYKAEHHISNVYLDIIEHCCIQGKGNRQSGAKPLTDEDIDQMWETAFLGPHTPCFLLNTI
ncbi:hypothetical protein DPMN_142658 [Dreissena polymorpha]|uniref:Uncharacterized protein n=1 Tax=Dreissena polymorpha TaxID=45954 RepID=A0A9D4GBP3_DREPO|nr:hypothetical protein DPMN_142658 [Dreissena polymorpha]